MIHSWSIHGRLPVSRFRARHSKDGEPAVLIAVPMLFTLDEAARALAIVYRDRTRPVTGLNALQQGLGQAAAERVLENHRTTPAPELVEHYRTALVQADVFPS